MKRSFVRGLVGFALIFPLLFAGRLLYGYHAGADADPVRGMLSAIGSDSWEGTRKNYATSKVGRMGQAGKAPAVEVDQKYEKIATLRAETTQFDKDEQAVRDSIKRNNALIQFEESDGLAGERTLRLSIGVPPEHFEPMLEEVRRIGRLRGIQVNKSDKTNEYKDLDAQRRSLEKTRDGLLSLKTTAQGANVADQISLANRILEIEEQIQKMGVRLGEFDQENEFVTIHLTLDEKRTAAPVSRVHRVKVAFVWTVEAYAVFLAFALIASLVTLIGIAVLEKLKVIPELIARNPPKSAS